MLRFWEGATSREEEAVRVGDPGGALAWLLLASLVLSPCVAARLPEKEKAEVGDARSSSLIHAISLRVQTHATDSYPRST